MFAECEHRRRDVFALMREGERQTDSSPRQLMFNHFSRDCARWYLCVRTRGRVRASAILMSRRGADLKALGADFLAFLHPGDPGFGLPGGLAHK